MKTRQLIAYHHNKTEPTDIMDTDIKTYKTIDGLYKALQKHGIHEHRHLVVWTETGRVTAIFADRNFKEFGISYMGYYGQFGFMVYG